VSNFLNSKIFCSVALYRRPFVTLTVIVQRPGAVLFNAGYNKQVFLLNPEKILAQIRLVVFEKKQRNAHFNSENKLKIDKFWDEKRVPPKINPFYDESGAPSFPQRSIGKKMVKVCKLSLSLPNKDGTTIQLQLLTIEHSLKQNETPNFLLKKI